MKNFKIYQIDNEAENARYIRFSSLDLIESMGLKVTKDLYKMVWEGETEDDTDLEDIFINFNYSRPEGFKGHSLSVSDVIEMSGKFYFCDSYEFVEVAF